MELPSIYNHVPCMERTFRGYGFERLDVYWLAVEHYRIAKQIVKCVPASLDDKDQYLRAAKSIIRNICEGAGEYRRSEKARFYRMAIRSAEECGGIIAILRADFGNRNEFDEADAVLTRIIPMLVKLCKVK
jgi:four helix bundle protein